MENIEIKNCDEYFLFYEMMMQSLKTNNVVKGIDKSLYLLKLFLNSGSIVLHKKNDNGEYVHIVSDALIADSVKNITCIVNKTSSLVENKGKMKLDLNLSDNFKNMMFLNLKTGDSSYILSINNHDNNKRELDADFYDRLKDTMEIILKRAESYERNIKAVSTDLLTDLDNRNSYEMRLSNLNNEDGSIVFGLFDLFRLKYVNDNHTHDVGDLYIKETAKILKKYWPKYKTEIIGDTEHTVETGHCVYRIGGDEFVLISTKEPIDLTTVKASLAAEEVSMIDLGVDEDIAIGLNVGVLLHNNGSIKKTYMMADEMMNQDKTKMYQKYGLDRRQR